MRWSTSSSRRVASFAANGVHISAMHAWRRFPAPLARLRNDHLSQPPALRSRRAAFIYGGGVREAILALKYEGKTAVVGPLIAAIGMSVIPNDVDLLVAVPMHGRRRRMRGFN